jgi:hypothetical protein
MVINFFIIKPTRCTNFSNLFWHETLQLSEIHRVSWQNKFEKIVHLLCFIIKKNYVTRFEHSAITCSLKRELTTMQIKDIISGHIKDIYLEQGSKENIYM